MITPVNLNIGWRTYVIFAVINAFIVPYVYFFHPETTYRPLEEIFEPRCFGKNGEPLADYA
ncbi:hypothetical protein VTI28DRAFT_3044 [Corynascus sepedonium]